MKHLEINLKNTLPFIDEEEYRNYEKKVLEQEEKIATKSGKGSDFLGWVDLPVNISKEFLQDINNTADLLKEISDFVVVVGIGGSYLGSKAVIEALTGQFDYLKTKKENPHVLFAGQNLSEDYHYELLDFLKDKRYSVVVISKSGTTTEPAIAFRLLRKDLEERFGKEEAAKRIVAVTDASKGALRNLTDQENYKSFVIADDIGGRYSVLTPVGLLPIACAGFNIEALIEGAKAMKEISEKNTFRENPVYQYAAIRNILYSKDKTTEILANYNPRLSYMAEWWKQLYGESEGKENKGIFPASVSFTTDLHSLGQYIQEGLRNIFETVISVEKTNYTLNVTKDKENFDKLNYLAGKPYDYINRMAELGTTLAHVDGGVPNIKIILPQISDYYLGELIYFFEKACAISGYLLDINPFDQPGVEAYKNNMFALLEKPGFEEQTKKIKTRIS